VEPVGPDNYLAVWRFSARRHVREEPTDSRGSRAELAGTVLAQLSIDSMMTPASACVICGSANTELLAVTRTDAAVSEHRRCTRCGCEWTMEQDTYVFSIVKPDRRQSPVIPGAASRSFRRRRTDRAI
jgi:hypothetical protein